VSTLSNTAALRETREEQAAPPGRALPEVPRRLRLGMPHLDAGGLSESWLLRHAGDLCWEAIGRLLGVGSDGIRGEASERLYPTVVALRARYDRSLAAARENDLYEARVEVTPCGGACAHGLVAARAGEARIALELLTTFARRELGGALRVALPAARLAARWAPVGRVPQLAELARAARRGEPLDDPFCGPSLSPPARALGGTLYEPSPYTEYNGAGLLYFASYAAIADTVERRVVHARGLAPAQAGGRDWALASSPVRRDVFFHRNLPLGEALDVRLLAFETLGAAVKSRVRLCRAGDGAAVGDVVTLRQLGPFDA
jgi:probable biosynthetic protein (TIGR04098 family)